MNKKLLFSLLLAGTAFTGHADEARLLRFPATNGPTLSFLTPEICTKHL